MTSPNGKPGGLDYLDKVRKLLTQAEGVAGTPEADTFNERAAALMAQHGIDAAMVAADNGHALVPGDSKIRVDNPYARDKTHLACQIALAMGCKAVRNTCTRGKHLRYIDVHLFGMETDLRRVEMLYTSLLVQVVRGAARIHIPYSCRTSSQVAAHRRTWMLGFTTAVRDRVKAAEQHAAASTQQARTAAGKGGPSTELVLMDRAALVQARVDAQYPGLKTGPTRLLSGGGYEAGIAAGQRADLGAGRNVTAASARREIG